MFTFRDGSPTLKGETGRLLKLQLPISKPKDTEKHKGHIRELSDSWMDKSCPKQFGNTINEENMTIATFPLNVTIYLIVLPNRVFQN